MKAWGADVVEHGADFDLAREEAEQRAAEDNAEFVPSFSRDLIRGVATGAFELMTACPNLDLIYCPIGMGSGICSLIQVRNLLGRNTKIVGVVSAHADAIAQTFETGLLASTTTAHTFADGVATRIPNIAAVDTIREGVDRIVRVTDNEVAEAIRKLYRCTHNIAEGAGATAYAAACQEKEKIRGRRVAVMLTGGNIDKDWLVQVLSGRTPEV